MIGQSKGTLVELVTSHLKLREFSREDFHALRDMDARTGMHTFEREPPTEVETSQSLDEYIRNQSEVPRLTYRLAITIPPSNEVKGLVKLARQWEAIREWEVGWAIHPDEWGRGYAAEAARPVMDWAFHDLHVHRIVAFCHSENAASIRVMEKLGMHQDGRLRETRWLNGKWWDEFIYSILETEWVERSSQPGSLLG